MELFFLVGLYIFAWAQALISRYSEYIVHDKLSSTWFIRFAWFLCTNQDDLTEWREASNAINLATNAPRTYQYLQIENGIAAVKADILFIYLVIFTVIAPFAIVFGIGVIIKEEFRISRRSCEPVVAGILFGLPLLFIYLTPMISLGMAAAKLK